MPGGSPPTRASPAARPRSWFPRSPSTSTRSATTSRPATPRVASRPSWSWPRAPSPRRGRWRWQSREVDQFGHARLGGIANLLAAEIEERTGFETRVTILGHIQRGGTPTAFDRVLATRFGIAAIDAVHDGGFGQMVALQADQIVRVPLAEAVTELKTVDPELLHGVAAEVFFG